MKAQIFPSPNPKFSDVVVQLRAEDDQTLGIEFSTWRKAMDENDMDTFITNRIMDDCDAPNLLESIVITQDNVDAWINSLEE